MLLLATNWTFFRGQSCGGGDSRPTIDAADGGGFLNGRGKHNKNVVGDDSIRNNNSCFECTFESFDRLMDEIDDNGRIFEDALPVGSCSLEPDRNFNCGKNGENDADDRDDGERNRVGTAVVFVLVFRECEFPAYYSFSSFVFPSRWQDCRSLASLLPPPAPLLSPPSNKE
mgnify:CR=1 FL=1